MKKPLDYFFKEIQSVLSSIPTYLDGEINDEFFFIQIHTLKGAASFLQFKNIQVICHAMEELLLQKKTDQSSWLSVMDQLINEKVSLSENYLTFSENESLSSL